MPLDSLILFIPACFALNMAFGPNNLLSMTIGARQGVRLAVLASTGRLLAFTAMIAVSALGMGALLMASETAFTAVKLAGAAYLVWLGIRMLRSGAALPSGRPETGLRPGGHDLRGLARQEFLVAAGNPKAILIFTAFFPQFVLPGNYWGSFLILGIVFLLLELVAIACYACAGARLNGLMRSAGGLRWINRVGGATMIGFGLLLAAARRPAA